jgi:hypothetical protein
MKYIATTFFKIQCNLTYSIFNLYFSYGFEAMFLNQAWCNPYLCSACINIENSLKNIIVRTFSGTVNIYQYISYKFYLSTFV